MSPLVRQPARVGRIGSEHGTQSLAPPRFRNQHIEEYPIDFVMHALDPPGTSQAQNSDALQPRSDVVMRAARMEIRITGMRKGLTRVLGREIFDIRNECFARHATSSDGRACTPSRA